MFLVHMWRACLFCLLNILVDISFTPYVICFNWWSLKSVECAYQRTLGTAHMQISRCSLFLSKILCVLLKHWSMKPVFQMEVWITPTHSLWVFYEWVLFENNNHRENTNIFFSRKKPDCAVCLWVSIPEERSRVVCAYFFHWIQRRTF